MPEFLHGPRDGEKARLAEWDLENGWLPIVFVALVTGRRGRYDLVDGDYRWQGTI